MSPTRAGVRAFAVTDAGPQRESNEDAVLVNGRLLAVADGMGGHERGEVASAIAIEALRALGPDPSQGDVDAALRTANAAIRADRSEGSRMGTTCTAMLVGEGVAHVAHIGDSRGYLLRDGRIRRLTEDHGLLATMVRAGVLTEDQASQDPRRHVILRALGAEDEPEVDTSEVRLVPGDRLLLATDGLHGVVDDEAIRQALVGNLSPEQAARELVALAIAAGASDNITVVVGDYGRARADGGSEAADIPVREGPTSRSLRRVPVVAIATITLVLVVVAILALQLGPRLLSPPAATSPDPMASPAPATPARPAQDSAARPGA